MATKVLDAQARIEAVDRTGRVFAQVASKMRVMDQAAKATRRSMAAMTGASAAVASRRNLGSGMMALSPLAGRLVGPAAIAYGMKKAIDESVSFERKMYEVEKAANLTGDASRRVADSLLELSRATGKTKEELADMYAAGGYAGRPAADLLRYTEFAAKATVAWGTDAKETGQALAEIGNIFQANQSRIEEIGDAINYVADASASSERDLLEFIRRSGAAGKQAGLSAEQTLAFGAAYKEVGVTTEIASTSFNTLMNALALGDGFLKDSSKGFKALGLNAKKVQDEFRRKPLETTVALLEKLSKVTDPIKRAEIMTNLFGKEHQDDIGFLLNNLPRLKELLAGVGDRGKYAGGVMGQFAAQASKQYFKLDQAIQSTNVALTRLGDITMTRVVGPLAEDFNNLYDTVNRFVEASKKWQEISGGSGGSQAATPALQQSSDPDSLASKLKAKERALFEGGDLSNGDLRALMMSPNPTVAMRAQERLTAQHKSQMAIRFDNEARSLAANEFALGAENLNSRLRFPSDRNLHVHTGRAVYSAATAAELRRLRELNEQFSEIHRDATTYPYAGDDSEARAHGTYMVPLPPPRPVQVEGDANLTVDLNQELKVTPNSMFDVYLEKKVQQIVAKMPIRSTTGIGSTGKSSPDTGASPFKFNSNGPR